MGVKVRTKKNEFPKMEKEFNSLNGKKIQVGVLGGGENAWLAGIHEYGCTIAVTDKMRGWLAAHGLHLKKSTTAIYIPERSFLRTGYDTNIDDVIKRVDRLLPLVGKGMSVDDFCDELGSMLADRIGSKGELAVNVSPDGKYGLTRDGAGQIKTFAATEADIKAGTNQYKPIVPSNFDYAVKKAIPNAENRYSTTPQRIGTWVDGTPIWRIAFEDQEIPYLEDDPFPYTDKSYSPLCDYTQSGAPLKFTNNIQGCYLIDGRAKIAFSTNSSGDYWGGLKDFEFDFYDDLFYNPDFNAHKTMYMTGWVEFITPESNIKKS